MEYNEFCIYRVISIKEGGKRRRIKEFEELTKAKKYLEEELKKGKKAKLITLSF